MKFGLYTAILGNMPFEQVVDTAFEMGFKCLEVACWPDEKSVRRYAGISHLDCARICKDPSYLQHIRDYINEKEMVISALAYYPNTMDADIEKRNTYIDHLKTVIKASELLGVDMVTTFIGRDQNKSVEENIGLVKQVWPDIVAWAEKCGVKIAIENCPMLFGPDQWPGGQNLMCTPALFKKLFDIIQSPNIGLNFDPSHFVWQGLDYIKTVYEFKDKLFHIHFKDIKLYPNKLSECGVLAYPVEYMSPKIPGLGDVNWGAFVSALNDICYKGCAVIEIEDKAFEGSREDVIHSIELSKKYLSQFVA